VSSASAAAPLAEPSTDAASSATPIPVDPRLLSGWGRTAPSLATVSTPRDAAGVRSALTGAGTRGVVPRGLGRSYGDAAQNAGGLVVDATRVEGVRALDLVGDLVTVGAGTSLAALTRALVPHGRFLPVVPGTGQVTVGGAIACDIHGKSHHRDGGFAAHVASFDLATADGSSLRVTPDDMPDVFGATSGGMGLTGVVVEATLRMLRIETSRMLVDTERAEDLDDAMARLESGDHHYRYSVAWVDTLAGGRRLGRSVLSRGDHAPARALDGAALREPLALDRDRSVAAPPWAPSWLLRPATVRAFNEAWFRRAPREERGRLAAIRGFFHPLDGVRGWNRLYGRAGMLQYQLVVPFGAEGAIRAALERLARARAPSFLAVLKRLGAESGPLSFPMPGWTLTLDMPAGREVLAEPLDEVDRMVAEAGGRVYLAKDSRLQPELLPRMYPRIDEWRAVRNRLDPDRRMCSDLARRLGL
jgi:decaprenylphospho-beta-D-ribofuranose 2-oxidase